MLPAAPLITEANLIFDELCESICQCGWAMQDNFLSIDLADELLKTSKRLFADRQFHPAGIGSGTIDSRQRTDHTLWIDLHNCQPSQQQLCRILDELKCYLNRQLFLGLEANEIHAVTYPPGAFYKRHWDNRKNSNRRILTWILYLNPQWQASDGGQLRIYLDEDSHLDIAPLHNRLVCFLSDHFEHEVLKTLKTRNSLTGWFGKTLMVP